MAQVQINSLKVLNNPAKANQPFCFDITFESFSNLPGSLDWKIIYIGSPSNNMHDQVIDSWEMENINTGVMNFKVESEHPNFSLIPSQEIIGTTAILISVAYEKQQFFRVGYYVRNEYEEGMEVPTHLNLNLLNRYILEEKARIFRFEIEWIKKEGEAVFDQNLLNQNLQIMGGDPFQGNNGAFKQLDQMNYAFGMFNGSSNGKGNQNQNQGGNGWQQ